MLQYRPMLVAAAVLLGAITPLFAQQSGGTKVGVLTCKTSASIGLIVGSRQKLHCSFSPDNGGPPEGYTGHIGRLGLDLGVKAGGVMAWGVFAPTNGLQHGALAGTYGGAKWQRLARRRRRRQCSGRRLAPLDCAAAAVRRRLRRRQSGVRCCRTYASFRALEHFHNWWRQPWLAR